MDLTQEIRTDEVLAACFDEFGRLECAATRLGVSGGGSPTYAVLSRHVAGSAALLALARECRVGQPVPNLVFAAVKRLLAEEPQGRLAELYRCAVRSEEVSRDLPREFERFCLAHVDAIVNLVQSRSVQTNEVGRCSFLMPAFSVVAGDAGRNLALIDVGAGAGLNLLWDRFDYRYSDGSRFGSGRSLVRIDCESEGKMPRIPKQFPGVSYRVGIDRYPVDLGDDEQYQWLQALIWPEHADRMARLAGARRLWLQERPRIEAGDALELLPVLMDETPADAALCVCHSHSLNQFSADARAAFAELLGTASQARPVYTVAAEDHDLVVKRQTRGLSTTLLEAGRNAHGRWVEWQDATRFDA